MSILLKYGRIEHAFYIHRVPFGPLAPILLRLQPLITASLEELLTSAIALLSAMNFDPLSSSQPQS
jgi:hypothetical protein